MTKKASLADRWFRLPASDWKADLLVAVGTFLGLASGLFFCQDVEGVVGEVVDEVGRGADGGGELGARSTPGGGQHGIKGSTLRGK